MENKNIIALAKLVKKAAVDKARPSLKPGIVDIDVAVHIKGTITVGEDYDTAPTVSIPLKETLALFIVYSGLASSQVAMDNLVKALYGAIELSGKGKGAILEAAENGTISASTSMITAAMQMVEDDLIKKLPRDYRSGAVTTQLRVTELELAELEPALV